MYIQETDFKGKWEIHQGMYSYEKINGYITRYTPIYMTQLLGAELYKKYLNDQGASPCFIKINEPFVEELPNYFGNSLGFNNGLLISDGIKDMMTGFLYFEIMKDDFTQATIYGEVKQIGEVSTKTNALNTLIYNRYNEAVRTYNAIQQYIITHMDDFGGEIVDATMSDFGTGYAVQDNVDLLGVATIGYGATINITSVDSNAGEILNFEFDNLGRDYSVNDVLIVDAGNQDATMQVNKIGENYDGFHGVKKSTAYWL